MTENQAPEEQGEDTYYPYWLEKLKEGFLFRTGITLTEDSPYYDKQIIHDGYYGEDVPIVAYQIARRLAEKSNLPFKHSQ